MNPKVKELIDECIDYVMNEIQYDVLATLLLAHTGKLIGTIRLLRHFDDGSPEFKQLFDILGQIDNVITDAAHGLYNIKSRKIKPLVNELIKIAKQMGYDEVNTENQQSVQQRIKRLNSERKRIKRELKKLAQLEKYVRDKKWDDTYIGRVIIQHINFYVYKMLHELERINDMLDEAERKSS